MSLFATAQCYINRVCVVTQVAEEAVQRHAGDQAVNWLDHGTEHPHRIALSVHIDSLQDCLGHLHHGFQQHAVQVPMLCLLDPADRLAQTYTC